MRKLFIIGIVLGVLFLNGNGSFAAEEKELGDMVVTATRVEQDKMDVPFNVSVVTRSDIEEMGAVNLEQALRRIPGLQFGTQGNAYPHIEVRGFRDTKDLAVLINGIPYRQVDGSADLTMIPLGIVERIEFVKGPSSSIWGRGAVAGTLNIITVPEDKTKDAAAAVVRAGSFGTYGGDGRFFIPHDKGYVMVSGGATTSDGYQDDTDRDAQNAMATMQYQLSDTFGMGIQALFSNVDAKRGSTIPIVDGEPMDGFDYDDNYGLDEAKYEGNYQEVTLSPTLDLTDHIRIKDDLTFTRFESYATGGITIIDGQRNKGWWVSDKEQTAVHNDLQMTITHENESWDNTFLMGMYTEIASMNLDRPSYSWSSMPQYGPPDWETPLTNVDNPGTGTTNGTVNNSDYDQKIISLYAQDTVEFSDIILSAGLRYDSYDEELKTSTTDVIADQSDSAFSPRFGLTWNFYEKEDKRAAFFANYTEGFRTQFPSLSTSGGVTLPNLLDPEKTKSYEAGFKYSLGNSLFAQASYFHVKKDGPRSFRRSAEEFLFTNAEIKVDGIEMEMDWRVTDTFSTWFHYAYHNATYEKFVDSSGNSFEGNRVRMSPRHIAGIGANLKLFRANWNVSANYVGDRNLRDNTTGNLQNLDSYVVVNTALSYPVDRFTLQLAVSNIFDEFYIADDFSSNNAGYPGEPRNITFSIKTEF